ncbi:MAG: ABC transporter ATP-binding protein/permease [Lachnospiraceae bacterium]|nr:ABC transporter ATP-binding protein/permease [Lachnospiraceae bacterium]
MKLLYDLPPQQKSLLNLAPGEAVEYAVPLDLTYDSEAHLTGGTYAGKGDSWIVVSEQRLWILEKCEVKKEILLSDCAEIRCEPQIYSGILTVTYRQKNERAHAAEIEPNSPGWPESETVEPDFTADPSSKAAGPESVSGSSTERNSESKPGEKAETDPAENKKECLARFSMREMVRVSYVARGANLYAQGEHGKVVSQENETYCEKCGRALPGTSVCPYCSGKTVMFRKFWNLCDGYQFKLMLISCLTVIVSVINVLMPVVQQRFIDRALTDGSGTLTDVLIFAGTLFGMLALAILVESLRYWFCVTMGADLSMTLRQKLYYKIQTLSLSFINVRKPGELMNRVTGDTTQIRQFMIDVFGDMVGTLATMAASLVMMFVLDVKMTLLSLAMVLAVVLITRIFWHHIHSIFHRQWLKNDTMRNGLSDIISGIRIVKAFGKEKEESERFRKLADDFAAVNKKNETFWAVFFPLLTFLLGFGTYIAIYFGGISILQGDMTTGQLVQFITYTGYLYGPLSWMTHLPREVMQMLTSTNRIYDVLDQPSAIRDSERAKNFPIQGDVAFQDVTFGYHSYEPVLNHISFEAKRGEMIGLVGASGTGKSTVINLLMRLYDADDGSITIDGTDIRDIAGDCLHGQIGVVLQENFLFSGSILSNIRFAKPDATMQEVIRAAKAANAHDFICRTPDGYDTYVGESGYSLSGGERQRIAIARAILNDPKLLILDEATASLDTESEYMIQQAMERLTDGRTTIAIAHRLSTLRNATRLVVLDDHRVAECGTHEELMEKQGIYYKLVMAQLAMAGGETIDPQIFDTQSMTM